MTDKLRLVYVPREDATPEGETAALAQVYRYILFQCSEQRKAAGTGGGDSDEAAEHARAEETAPEKGEP